MAAKVEIAMGKGKTHLCGTSLVIGSFQLTRPEDFAVDVVLKERKTKTSNCDATLLLHLLLSGNRFLSKTYHCLSSDNRHLPRLEMVVRRWSIFDRSRWLNQPLVDAVLITAGGCKKLRSVALYTALLVT